RDDLLRRHDGRADRHVRVSGDSAAHRSPRDAPHDRVLARFFADRRGDCPRGILLRVSFRSSPRPGGSGARRRGARARRRRELARQVVKPVLWLCFMLSGAAALGLELLWLRSAALVVGATAATAASVLASYFAGLALGGLYAREARAHPVRRYGTLELAAAAAVPWSYAVFSVAASDSAARALGAGGLIARVALVALAIGPATFFLGATLPTIGHALATAETVG